MAQTPKSFEEAFGGISAELQQHLLVSSTLLNLLLVVGLLNEVQVEELQVNYLCHIFLYSVLFCCDMS